MAAQAAADLALAHAAIKRYTTAINWAERGQRQFKDLKDLTITAQGHSLTLLELRDQLRQSVPSSIKNRWPTLPDAVATKDGTSIPLDPRSVFSKDGNPHPIFNGKLLSPLETDPNLRRADAFFACATPGKVSMIQAVTLAHTPFNDKPEPKWTVDLNEPGAQSRPCVLLGCAGNTAVFVANDGAAAIDIEKGTLKWKAPFEMTDDEQNRYAEQANRVRALAMQQQQMGMINNGAVIFNGEEMQYGGNNPLLNFDVEQKRTLQFNSVLGRTRFTSLHILGTHMFAIIGNRLLAYDIVTGKKSWRNPVTLPEGLPMALVGNDELVVVQVDNPDKGTPTFVSIDIDTGKWRGTLKLDDERVTWRQISDDGTLFTISDQAVSAYDLHGDLTNFLWKNKDLRQLKYASTAILSLDSLLVINNNNELLCLPQEGGDSRWEEPPQLLHYLPQASGQWLALHSAIDGDNVVLTCTQGCVAYNTASGRVSWSAEFNTTPIPPLVENALADPYMVILGNGPLGTARHAVRLFALDRRPGFGKICLDAPMDRTGMGADHQAISPEGPNITSWQVVDNAILFHVSGVITSAGTLPDAVLAFRPTPKPAN